MIHNPITSINFKNTRRLMTTNALLFIHVAANKAILYRVSGSFSVDEKLIKFAHDLIRLQFKNYFKFLLQANPQNN